MNRAMRYAISHKRRGCEMEGEKGQSPVHLKLQSVADGGLLSVQTLECTRECALAKKLWGVGLIAPIFWYANLLLPKKSPLVVSHRMNRAGVSRNELSIRMSDVTPGWRPSPAPWSKTIHQEVSPRRGEGNAQKQAIPR